MSSSSDTLRFRFPTHGDSILSKINALRAQRRFCDVTLLLGDPRGTSVRPLHFPGHRAVLAASSDFLRDQFLLHEDRDELSVGVVSGAEVGERLLLSCYTGLLEVPSRELVSYLTAASALQMTQVVEKCARAISQYLSPTLALLKPEAYSEEEETLQPGRKHPGFSFKNQEKTDAARSDARIQEGSAGEGGADVIQSVSRSSQGGEVAGREAREIGDDGMAVVAETERSEDAACRPGASESEEGARTNKPSHRNITGVSTAARDHGPSTRGGPARHEELERSFQRQGEEAEEEQRQEEECTPMTRRCGDEPTEGPDSVQRPYLCRRCHRVFQHLESYAGHLKERRKFLCLVCGKGFSQRSDLTRHVQAGHAGVKLHRCPLCHKTFSQRATLRDHISVHTEDRPHERK